MKKLFVLVILCYLIACTHIQDKPKITFELAHKKDYNIEINYTAQADSLISWGNDKFPKDTLYLTCEYYFTNKEGIGEAPDGLTLTVFKNMQFFRHETQSKNDLETDGRSFINLGSIKNIRNIGIQINDGNIAYIEIDSTKHVVRAKYSRVDKTLKIDFLNSVPKYR